MAIRFRLTTDREEATCFHKQEHYDAVISQLRRDPIVPGAMDYGSKWHKLRCITRVTAEVFSQNDTRAIQVTHIPTDASSPATFYWVVCTEVSHFDKWYDYKPSDDPTAVGCRPSGPSIRIPVR